MEPSPAFLRSQTAPITQLIGRARCGDSQAIADLCASLYPELRRIARARLRAQAPLTLLDTTGLVHESFLRLYQLQQLDVGDRVHFLAYAARVMRSILVDFIRARHAERRGGDAVHTELSDDLADTLAAEEAEVLRIHEALESLASVDERAARVVEMRYFGGMTEAEIALALEVTERTVRRDWEKARLLLRAALD